MSSDRVQEAKGKSMSVDIAQTKSMSSDIAQRKLRARDGKTTKSHETTEYRIERIEKGGGE
jgi:hypothetical protein